MKKLEIIIRPEKLDALKELLMDNEVKGMNISNVMGFGSQLGYTEQYRGTKFNVNFVSKMKVEVVLPTEKAQKVIDEIKAKLRTGQVGDGKIFVYAVEKTIRIRTGEEDEAALG